MVDGLARAGAPTQMVSGVRMALERSSRGGAVPVASSITALVIAIFAVVGALTFGSGLGHLLSTPRLTGVTWDLLLPWPQDGEGPVDQARLEIALADDVGVESFELATWYQPFPHSDPPALGPDGQRVLIVGFGGSGQISPAVIAGRAPGAPDEILIGTETLEQLGLRIGDEVTAHARAGEWHEPGEPTAADFEIVGVGVVPNEGGPGRLGRGAALTLGGIQRLNPQADPTGYWVRLRDGADPAEVVGRVLTGLGARATEDILPAEAFAISGATGLRQIDRAPLVLAGVMGVLMLGVIVHVLVMSMRANRRDLAVLRSLGFRRRDVGRTMSWQSIALVLVALAIGVPLGIVVGRLTWQAYATRLGAVPEPTVPWVGLAVAIAVSFAVAILVARLLARRATRVSIANELRTE
jgi:putative ABC transport system permease protein